MMTDDTGFASDSVEVDSAYDTGLFGSDLAGYTEAERQVGSTPIPRFEKALLQVVGGEGQESENGPNYARPRIKVVDAPEGSVNREFFTNVFFHINPQKTKKDGSKVTRSPEELAKAKKELGDTLLKVQRVLGLSKPTPTNGTKEAITAWVAEAAEQARVFVGEIRIEPARGDFPARNSLALRSIAAVGDPVKDDKGAVIAGKTAGQDAKERIAAANAKKEKGGGVTAKSHGPAKPTGFRS